MVSPAEASPPTFDVVAAVPEVGWLRGFVATDDWPEVAAFLGRLPDDHDLAFFAGELIEMADVESFLARVVVGETGSTLPRVLFAGRQVALAWQAAVDDPSPHRSELIGDLLRTAEWILIDVTAREPGNVLAWTYRLMTARGLELGQSETRRRYDRLAAHNPHHYAAQRELLQQLCPQWTDGSWAAVHAFAADCARNAPPGSLQGALVAEGHLEHWLGLDRADRRKYLADPLVQQEIVAAAEVSVWHPEFRRRHGWVGAHSVFALMFGLADDYARARAHFEAVGDLVSEFPWRLFADKETVFAECRRLAYENGAPR